MPQRLFVDMDGTLAVFNKLETLEDLYEQGYFLNLAPHVNVVGAIKHIVKTEPRVQVRILSAVLTDSDYAFDEKNAWLDRHLPEITRVHRIFVPCGSDKKGHARGGVAKEDFLLDDYTQNLLLWEAAGRGIKLLNGINNTRGTWTGDRIRFDKHPAELARDILDIMAGRNRVFDIRPQDDPQTTHSAPENPIGNAAMRDRRANSNRNSGRQLR